MNAGGMNATFCCTCNKRLHEAVVLECGCAVLYSPNARRYSRSHAAGILSRAE